VHPQAKVLEHKDKLLCTIPCSRFVEFEKNGENGNFVSSFLMIIDLTEEEYKIAHLQYEITYLYGFDSKAHPCQYVQHMDHLYFFKKEHDLNVEDEKPLIKK